MNIAFSMFENHFSTAPHRVRVPWTRLIDRLCQFTFTDDKASVPLWAPSVFKGSRSAANVEWVTCCVWDYDDGTTVEDAIRPWLDWPFVFHTTHSHKPDHHKFRIILPLAEPIPGSKWKTVWSHLRDMCEYPPDPKCVDPSRMYYLPSAPLSAKESGDYGASGHDLNKCGYLKVEKWFWNPKQAPKRVRATDRIKREWDIIKKRRDPALNESRSAREALAARVGAALTPVKAKSITCPACAKTSVWFWLEPGKQNNAYCNHENSCGWSGHLGEL
tara:strand:+ start:7773 stop:8594 length:822 start_codon:yes stop_codon:yes gene_type:complete